MFQLFLLLSQVFFLVLYIDLAGINGFFAGILAGSSSLIFFSLSSISSLFISTSLVQCVQFTAVLDIILLLLVLLDIGLAIGDGIFAFSNLVI